MVKYNAGKALSRAAAWIFEKRGHDSLALREWLLSTTRIRLRHPRSGLRLITAAIQSNRSELMAVPALEVDTYPRGHPDSNTLANLLLTPIASKQCVRW